MGRQSQRGHLPEPAQCAEREPLLRQPATTLATGPVDARGFFALCNAVRESLPRDRYRHVLGVARTAERLARRYGAPARKARIAAMVHDIARMWTTDKLLQYARDHGLAISATEQQAPVLLHARIGAQIGRERFGIDDPQMLLAIERHTVAVVGMSDLEKILYIADSIEPSRVFPERAALVAAADLSLDEGLKACVKSSMDYLTERGIPIAPATLVLYNQLVQRSEA